MRSAVAPMSLPEPAQRIEDALSALLAVIRDTSQPRDVRARFWKAYRSLHGCRDAVTVRRMEKRMGVR